MYLYPKVALLQKAHIAKSALSFGFHKSVLSQGIPILSIDSQGEQTITVSSVKNSANQFLYSLKNWHIRYFHKSGCHHIYHVDSLFMVAKQYPQFAQASIDLLRVKTEGEIKNFLNADMTLKGVPLKVRWPANGMAVHRIPSRRYILPICRDEKSKFREAIDLGFACKNGVGMSRTHYELLLDLLAEIYVELSGVQRALTTIDWKQKLFNAQDILNERAGEAGMRLATPSIRELFKVRQIEPEFAHLTNEALSLIMQCHDGVFDKRLSNDGMSRRIELAVGQTLFKHIAPWMTLAELIIVGQYFLYFRHLGESDLSSSVKSLRHYDHWTAVDHQMAIAMLSMKGSPVV